MPDLIALNEAIENSGLKKKAIAEKMGLTAYGLNLKLTGVYEFKVSEANKISEILNFSDAEKRKIFFTSNVS